LIHVVDASGSIDEEGSISSPGSGNPVQDVMDIEMEIEFWISHIVDRNKPHILAELESVGIDEALNSALTGIKTKPPLVAEALKQAELSNKPFKDWSPEDTRWIYPHPRRT
jgi:ribosome-binding ATPase YchF (GTP1/OBG family)